MFQANEEDTWIVLTEAVLVCLLSPTLIIFLFRGVFSIATTQKHFENDII